MEVRFADLTRMSPRRIVRCNGRMGQPATGRGMKLTESAWPDTPEGEA